MEGKTCDAYLKAGYDVGLRHHLLHFIFLLPHCITHSITLPVDNSTSRVADSVSLLMIGGTTKPSFVS